MSGTKQTTAVGRSAAGQTLAKGYTLVELMIAVAIIGIIAAIAMPIYNNYIGTSREGALLGSIATIRVFQEDFRLRNGTYAGGTYDDGADVNLAVLDWEPDTDDIVFVVAANAGVSYTVTATDQSGYSTCRQFPDNDPCP
jgi:type IV pilus assembly protein PilE